MAQIVVVEDDLYMREELIDLLSKSGYDTFPISEFEDVVSQIQAIAPDLIRRISYCWTSIFLTNRVLIYAGN